MTDKEFVEKRVNAHYLETARRQQRQIAYFTESSIQEEITQTYITAWAQRKYRSNDYFLNWVKMIFRTENFLSFYKYMRHPLPSAKLINDEIIPQLKRIYFADDSFFKYTIKNKEVEAPEELNHENFENKLFNAILFNFNDIIIHDLEDVNKPFRDLLCIDHVVAIESRDNQIQRISYQASIQDENGDAILGFAYMDAEKYVFFDKDYNERVNETHDLGICPACWVANEPFSTKTEIVRKSIFSYLREELEEYVFLKTLLKMTEPNGAIPVTIKLEATEKPKSKDGADKAGTQAEAMPLSSAQITSQQAEMTPDVIGSGSQAQAGTVIEVPLVKNPDGTWNMEVINNFMKHIYIPTECLDYIVERIEKIEYSIITNATGNYTEISEAAKNEKQIKTGQNNRQDKLRSLAMNMSTTRKNSDFILLALRHGPDAVGVDIFYGTDFFRDNESDLFDLFLKAPNPIERRNIIRRIQKSKFRFNKEQQNRQTLLYDLMPFVSDKDYATASEGGLIDNQIRQLQLQFDHWISMFESQYGDILIFFSNLDASNSTKLITIKNLLTDLIPKIPEKNDKTDKTGNTL